MLGLLLAFLLIPATPLLQFLAPAANTPMLLVTVLASCALVGWAAGGRRWLAVIWVGVAVVLQVWLGHPTGSYSTLERGWAVVLAASFGLVSIAAAPGTRFLPRALTALATSIALVGLLALVTHRGAASAEAAIRDAVLERPNAALDLVQQNASSPEWKALTATTNQGASLDSAVQTLEDVLTQMPHEVLPLFPALLALESLAALALAWSLYHRISRTRLGEPLAALRSFRFNDQLVWGLIAGAIFVLLPQDGPWRTLGFNLLVFFGALYAVRGLGVVVWSLEAVRAGVAAYVLLAVTAALVSAAAGGALAMIGLADIWLDFRRRVRQAPGAR